MGKTTMAAATALHLARSYPKDKKVLVISTDPAHSLSDSFGIEIGDKITPIEYRSKSKVQSPMSSVQGPRTKVSGDEKHSAIRDPRSAIVANLFARELDARRLLEAFKQKNNAIIKKLADRGTYFDKEDISEFFDLSLPGMDEVMAIIEMANLLRNGKYQVVVLDTAPTGHTLRMLALPEQMQKWLEVMDLMQHKYRYLTTHFSGRKYKKDECDLFLDRLSSDIDRVRRLLTNEEATRFITITIPEPMGVCETRRLMRSLEKMNIPVKEMIVNRVAEGDGCVFCVSRKEDQTQTLAQIEESFSGYDLIRVPVFPREIRGVEGLIGLADYLLGFPRSTQAPGFAHGDKRPRVCLALNPGLEFILFGGKGGVGKTTLASAAALHLARANPQKRILLFSTDPAHSLSDAFGQPIGDKITAISVGSGQWGVNREKEGKPNGAFGRKESAFRTQHSAFRTNLFALEIDSDRLFDEFREEFKKNITGIFDRFLSNKIDIKFDREVMSELLTLAPPGLDEIMALDRIMGLREKGEFDIFVLDMSPTGHLLRFLELPDMVREWLNAFFRLLLKYRGLVRLTGAAEKALAMSKNVRRIQETLGDPQRTAFFAVTIPEAMGLHELERLSGALEKAHIPGGGVVINMVVPETDCIFCFSKRAEQEGYIKEIVSRFPTRTITSVPLFPNEVRGIDGLNKIGEIVFGDGEQKPAAI